MNTKSILASKTFYLNLIAILLVFLPLVREWLTANAAPGVIALGVLNLAMRLMTEKRIAIFEGKGPDDDSQSGFRGPLWVLATAGMLGMSGSLPSCSPAQQEVLKATPLQACYIGEHGERICYSTKSGILVEVDQRSGK